MNCPKCGCICIEFTSAVECSNPVCNWKSYCIETLATDNTKTSENDFLLGEIEKEIEEIEREISSEKLAGNIVKEATARGEMIAFVKMIAWITRLKNQNH